MAILNNSSFKNLLIEFFSWVHITNNQSICITEFPMNRCVQWLSHVQKHLGTHLFHTGRFQGDELDTYSINDFLPQLIT